MIICDRCGKEIEVKETLMECCHVLHNEIDLTYLLSSGRIFRFCEKCWEFIVSKAKEKQGERI